mgnify:CR=1 FL=1
MVVEKECITRMNLRHTNSGAYAIVCGGFEWGSKMLGVNNMAVGLASLKAASRDEY